MSAKTIRYHVRFGEHRTTLSVDTMLSELLAIKLKTTPKTKEARRAVTAWLQERLPAALGEDAGAAQSASYFARHYIIEEIAEQRLYEQWLDWDDKTFEKDEVAWGNRHLITETD